MPRHMTLCVGPAAAQQKIVTATVSFVGENIVSSGWSDPKMTGPSFESYILNNNKLPQRLLLAQKCAHLNQAVAHL